MSIENEPPVFREKKIDDGGAAFPAVCPVDFQFANEGMSLRAYIATKVISGLCANPSIFQANSQSGWALANCSEGQLADCAVRIADEMIISLKAGAA